MIAETVGDDDAMDLFRHTTELSPHVCIILNLIEYRTSHFHLLIFMSYIK